MVNRFPTLLDSEVVSDLVGSDQTYPVLYTFILQEQKTETPTTVISVCSF